VVAVVGTVQTGEVIGYHGLPSLFEFTNSNGMFRRFNCGQAAACTLLAHLGRLPARHELMQAVEREFPPDNLGGWLGTSRRRVERICRAFGLPLTELDGEAELRACLAKDKPAMVMLGVPGPRVLRFTLPAGHWMVAYGFDEAHVYLSNYGNMTWDQFRAGWKALVPRLIRMNGRGLAVL
jgi:hypothetical protein